MVIKTITYRTMRRNEAPVLHWPCIALARQRALQLAAAAAVCSSMIDEHSVADESITSISGVAVALALALALAVAVQ